MAATADTVYTALHAISRLRPDFLTLTFNLLTTYGISCEQHTVWRLDSYLFVNYGMFPMKFVGLAPFLPRCMECRRGLAMKKLPVRPSVCLSVKRVDCDKMKESSVQILTPYER